MMKNYATEAEILTAPLLPCELKTRADALDEFRRQNPQAPPAPPKANPAERITLAQIRVSIIATRDNLLTLNGSEIQQRERLPGEKNTLADLQRNTGPNAPDSELLKIAAAQIRVQLLDDFIASAAARREELTRQMQGHLARLSLLVEPITGQKFFLSGSRPELNAAGAIAAIDALLK